MSQGRVESIVHSKPRDRRLLIEEAAGLGKHRKRRRRAQLKLERTQDNLARSLDVEREARSRLRPLKRQAEAAELHQRLERQSLDAGRELAADELRAARAELAEAERAAAAAGTARDEAERLLAEVARRREAAEDGSRSISARASSCRAACSPPARPPMASRCAQSAPARRRRRQPIDAGRDERDAAELEAGGAEERDTGAIERIAALEAELRTLDSDRDSRLEDELAELERERLEAETRREAAAAEVEQLRAGVVAAEQAVDQARAGQREAERGEEAARAAAAKAASELSALNEFLALRPPLRTTRAHSRRSWMWTMASSSPWRPRSDHASVPAWWRASVRASAARRAARRGSALVVGYTAPPRSGRSPAAGAERILDHVRPPTDLAPVVEHLLADAWLVEDLASVPRDFTGIAITHRGRALFGSTGELRQAPAGGEERILEARASRERLVAASEAAAADEAAARDAVARAAALINDTLERREGAHAQMREASRALDEADELLRRAARRIELRRAAPEDGQAAVKRARVEADLALSAGSPSGRSTSASSGSCGWCGCVREARAAARSRATPSAPRMP